MCLRAIISRNSCIGIGHDARAGSLMLHLHRFYDKILAIIDWISHLASVRGIASALFEWELTIVIVGLRATCNMY